ncbi:hypothetical protein HELRODRAFT_173132 [Helobdella robusta]|uniref:Transposable element P transposase n=1 Tax=Helobdella robusta TaxID=6412 RepID=T1F6F2_HELRO|nr:hypothetical protein HELRODRAFT_173132 [Helobdella robusta]ESO04058.1 hypothetical protein HELRODRAFT_173132 [Helobdella robusta]
MISDLMSRSVNDSNLNTAFKELKPEKRLINILYDEVQLKSVLRFTAGHVVGHAENQPEKLTTSALAFELVCHYGGPRFTIRITDANSLKEYLLEVITTIKYCGGRPISIICDNCPLNQRMYKNQLPSKTPLGMTKLTQTAVFPKVQQRQSVPLVCQVFDNKTVAAFEMDNLEFQPGTVEFVKLITSWFKMMNVKDRYSYFKLKDDKREPWKFNYESFKKLEFICNVVSTRQDTGKRCHKLTKFTADAFVVTTKFNIAASTELLSDHNFRYVLPAVFSQDPREKFFRQARQRFGATPDEQDLEMLQDITTENTENLIQSNNCLKDKIIFVADFLTRQYHPHLGNDDADDAQDFTVSSDYTYHF